MEGAVGRIVFDNPERHNSITADMFAALAAAADAYEHDREIRVVVISGAGGRTAFAEHREPRFQGVEHTRARQWATPHAFQPLAPQQIRQSSVHLSARVLK